MSVEEKRQHQRHPVEVSVQATGESGLEGSGASRDLSLGGMFLVTDAKFGFKEKLSLKITFPDERAFEVPAVVRWTMGDGVGVQFGLMGAAVTHALTTILKA